MELESESPKTDQNLNIVLSKALVDPWRSRWADCHLRAHEEAKEEFPQDLPLGTLTATGEERFVNTLISRDGEPDYVSLTSNLGLK